MMRVLLILLVFTPLLAFAIRLFPSPGDILEIVPIRCRSALSQNVTCSPLLITGQSAANGDYLTKSTAPEYCTSECLASIQSLQKNVASGCGSSLYTLYPNSTTLQSAQSLADGLAWAYSLVCLQDESGFCLDDYYHNNKDDCSDCALKYGAVLLSSNWGRARYSEEGFESILASCSVPESKYPWTYTPTSTPAPPTSTTAPPAQPTCTGTKYTVKQGDTCESISAVNSVGTDRMIDLNRLDYYCRTLTPGSTLCIDDQCKTMKVAKGQTCESIVKDQAFTVLQLQSWNPSLSGMCTTSTDVLENLDAIAGRSICISPPGGGDVPTISQPPSHTRPTLTSSMFDGWESVVPGTVPPDGASNWGGMPTESKNFSIPTQTGTADPVRESHAAELRKYCWITDEDWNFGYDPDTQPGACAQLFWSYCEPVSTATVPTASPRVPAACTPDRSHYNDTIPTPVPTPKPYQPGMIKGCIAFYKVSEGDTCASIAQANKVTVTDFYKWNPTVGDQCQGLQLGVYACVAYDARLDPDASTLQAAAVTPAPSASVTSNPSVTHVVPSTTGGR